ncbi:hypothetical protein C3747_24g70 [Trypanosoma cruzi]|uniref:Uncharacterized protein n=1 Tax=Trypanosoma cruzi TaxID=5693 RepID=A0A2V2X641_TRYCR|nr:hypothetical protein C3747_24g70 [Trypanosoma cruzi]
MCAEACSSIQRLLRESAEEAGALDEEVRGIVERDRAEEDALRGAATGAAHAEMGALRNERYAEFSRRRTRVLAERAAEGAVASPTSAGGRSCVCVGGCGASLCICARTPFLTFASMATLRMCCWAGAPPRRRRGRSATLLVSPFLPASRMFLSASCW